jgi:phosphatidylserine/phosphatidylglycerophosphate/cardiolipin synthase-like enzyme
MHNKFVVLDGAIVWTGSWNPTINDTFRNNNNMLRIADARVAENYTRKFQMLFDGKGGPEADVPLPHPVVELEQYRLFTAFAPQDDVTANVVEAIEAAQSSINVLAFTFTSDPIAEAMIAAHKRGVRVRGVIEGRNARASGSEMRRLQGAGLDIRDDGNCYNMHHKVFVIDGRTVITGSFNWTRKAQEQNDENSMIVDSPWLAQRYTEEFQHVYNQALKPSKCGR